MVIYHAGMKKPGGVLVVAYVYLTLSTEGGHQQKKNGLNGIIRDWIT